MSNGIDLLDFGRELVARQRGRAAILLSRDYPGQESWANRLAAHVGAPHLDLARELARQGRDFSMAAFSVDGLFRNLVNRVGAELLVVSGIEPIKASWSHNPRATELLAQQVETWNKKPALLFVLHHDAQLAGMRFTRFTGLRFVVEQEKTLKF